MGALKSQGAKSMAKSQLNNIRRQESRRMSTARAMVSGDNSDEGQTQSTVTASPRELDLVQKMGKAERERARCKLAILTVITEE